MKVKISPTNQEFEITSQKSLLQICTENKIEIRSLCKGKPSCAECRIRITAGEDCVNSPSQTELSLVGSNYYLDGRRLSCQVYCFGDVTIDISEQIDRQDSSAKKIRGFRGQTKSAQESQAKRDTFVLGEEAKGAEEEGGTGTEASPPPKNSNSGNRNRNQIGQQNTRGQGQGPQKNQPRNSNQNRNRQRPQNKNGPEKPEPS